jgi:dCMP deaminase
MSIFDKFDKFFIKVAEDAAQLSSAKRSQVGAVIARDKRIIATGYNGTPTGYFTNVCEGEDGFTIPATVHAEENAICHVAKSTESSAGATLYCTHAPCEKCAKLIRQSGIKRVIYRNDYFSTAGIDLLRSLNIDVEQYLENDECGSTKVMN